MSRFATALLLLGVLALAGCTPKTGPTDDPAPSTATSPVDQHSNTGSALEESDPATNEQPSAQAQLPPEFDKTWQFISETRQRYVNDKKSGATK
jgi:predicted small lipoprotein YifL